jgi:hypothetical protein
MRELSKNLKRGQKKLKTTYDFSGNKDLSSSNNDDDDTHLAAIGLTPGGSSTVRLIFC